MCLRGYILPRRISRPKLGLSVYCSESQSSFYEEYQIEGVFCSITDCSASNNGDFLGSGLNLAAVGQEALAEVGFGHDCLNRTGINQGIQENSLRANKMKVTPLPLLTLHVLLFYGRSKLALDLPHKWTSAVKLSSRLGATR